MRNPVKRRDRHTGRQRHRLTLVAEREPRVGPLDVGAHGRRDHRVRYVEGAAVPGRVAEQRGDPVVLETSPVPAGDLREGVRDERVDPVGLEHRSRPRRRERHAGEVLGLGHPGLRPGGRGLAPCRAEDRVPSKCEGDKFGGVQPGLEDRKIRREGGVRAHLPPEDLAEREAGGDDGVLGLDQLDPRLPLLRLGPADVEGRRRADHDLRLGFPHIGLRPLDLDERLLELLVSLEDGEVCPRDLVGERRRRSVDLRACGDLLCAHDPTLEERRSGEAERESEVVDRGELCRPGSEGEVAELARAVGGVAEEVREGRLGYEAPPGAPPSPGQRFEAARLDPESRVVLVGETHGVVEGKRLERGPFLR